MIAETSNRIEAPVIDMRGIETHFGKQAVHRGVDLKVMDNETVALVGGSGSGKTTLLRVILGLLQPSGGELRLFGIDTASANANQWDDIRSNWGVLFQSGALYSALSVYDNVAFPLQQKAGLQAKTIRRLVMSKLELVDLKPEDANKLPAELSGGMIKRVALARALITDPRLLLLDEPTSGLDPLTADVFVDLIARLRKELGLAVVMISHNLTTIKALADQVAVLADGKLVISAPLDEVRQSPHEFIQAYFNGPRAVRILGPVSGDSTKKQEETVKLTG